MAAAITLTKSAYVTSLRSLGGIASALGATGFLDRHQDNRLAHWLRSLMAIHDIDALIALDVPWWTYEAINEVEAFLSARSAAQVYEYGSGASTVWLGSRAGTVTSVEHDEAWAQVVRRRTGAMENVRLKVVPPDTGGDPAVTTYTSVKPGYQDACFEQYVRSIDEERSAFDLIVIDGRARQACLSHALPKLAEGGLIVFDNSGRRRYRDAIEAHALDACFLAGLAPSLPYRDETALIRPSVRP